MRGQLAAHQVERLDAAGALVELGDAGIAHQLLHARLANVAVPAEALQAEVHALEAGIGEVRLDHRRQQRDQVLGVAARVRIRVLAREVDLQRRPHGERAGAFAEGAHRHQHPPHIRVDDDRIGRPVGRGRTLERPSLQTLLGVGGGVLVSELGDARPCMPTASRAEFIIVNIARIPLCGSPKRCPVASSKLITQVAEARRPILCSIEPQRTPLRAPRPPFAAARNLAR